MEVAAGTSGKKDKTKGAAGRKDASKQPAVMDVTQLREELPGLKKLLVAQEDAAEDYKNRVTKVAEKTGMLAAVVNKVVKAWSGDDFEEERRKVEQLSLAFEEVAKA